MRQVDSQVDTGDIQKYRRQPFVRQQSGVETIDESLDSLARIEIRFPGLNGHWYITGLWTAAAGLSFREAYFFLLFLFFFTCAMRRRLRCTWRPVSLLRLSA